MVELNAHSVAEAMVSCYGSFNRRLCFVFSTYDKLRDFAIALHDQHREGFVPAMHYRRGIDEVFFDTGSSIKMISLGGGDNIRRYYGYKYHMVLYDPNIKDPLVLEHLRSLERPPCDDRSQGEMEIDTQPIDDFLDGFSVIKT